MAAINWTRKRFGNDEYLKPGHFVITGDYIGRRSFGKQEAVALVLVKDGPRPYHYAQPVADKWEVFGEFATLDEAKARAEADEPALR